MLALAGSGSLGAQEVEQAGGGIPPEFQLFINAREEIVQTCIYRPTGRDVVLGAMKGLSSRLGAKYSRCFPRALPKDPGGDMSAFAQAIREVAADPAAQAAGWTTKKLVERSIDSYCHSLDPYGGYTDEETSLQLDQAQQPDYVGIGLTLQQTAKGFFVRPFRGGSSARAGVRSGDEILEVDHRKAREMTLLELSDRLAGSPGSSVELRVQHKEGALDTLQVEREKIASTPITLEQSGSAWRIGFTRLDARALEDCRQALNSIGGGNSLVLDFRGCGGGQLEGSLRIAELFLPDKVVIAQFENSRGKEVSVSHNPAPFRPKRLVLLQDEGTASGAELIIAALLGYAPLKAESRGERTYGKGVTLRKVRVARGGYLIFADARIYGPHDEFWDRTGLPPTSSAAVDAP